MYLYIIYISVVCACVCVNLDIGQWTKQFQSKGFHQTYYFNDCNGFIVQRFDMRSNILFKK